MANYLYLLLDLGSCFLPLLFSFHPKIKFHQHFKPLFLGIAVSALVYLSWDVLFTQWGIWGFNAEYLCGIFILGLPLEELLFFVCIPFACLFTMEVLEQHLWKGYFPKRIKSFFYILVVLFLAIGLFNVDKTYTATSFILAAVITLLAIWKLGLNQLGSFLLGFLIILIPFFAVNGILTGSLLEKPVVWYNNAENLGIRIGTVPIDDVSYAWGMLLLPYLILQITRKK
ncbi:MAG: lycopene cyclase domain-containing protein [Luteibaculaceae bacterium]|jgi:lycopene cyclase domain-containing protein